MDEMMQTTCGKGKYPLYAWKSYLNLCKSLLGLNSQAIVMCIGKKKNLKKKYKNRNAFKFIYFHLNLVCDI